MQLNVLSQPDADDRQRPWYDGGLKFGCTQCGNCCTGPPGYVWLTPIEVERLAAFLGKTTEEIMRRHVRTINGRLSLKERRNERGEHDCVFLVNSAGDGKNGQRRRGCSVYGVRPLQCRTWPFWDGLLESPAAWKSAKRRCPGIDRGRWHPPEHVEAMRDAKDWPEAPPGSA